ncbi:MAG: RsmD family RNA methyltransferase [Bacteroidales bacterium]|nr:RsmD family RNA methyltransferase [Bacteroidales bacterium]
MRIVAGKYRGRHFDVPRTFKARPTTDFAKENLFNVLRGYTDFESDAPRALDLFAGTGSITLELLSRGCSHVTAVELDPQHITFIRRFLSALGAEAEARATVLRADVLRFLRKAPGTYDIIFADPPYALPELDQLPSLIFNLPAPAKPAAVPPPAAGGDLLTAPSQNGTESLLRSTLLAPGGIFVLEHGKTQDFSSHPCYVAHRAYGSVNFTIFQEPDD